MYQLNRTNWTMGDFDKDHCQIFTFQIAKTEKHLKNIQKLQDAIIV